MFMKCTAQIQDVSLYTKEELMALLKKKILCEVDYLMHSLERGYRHDIQFLLSEIKLLDMLKEGSIDETLGIYMLQYYLNNLWQTF
jgi:hypothetical protein|uniref:Uncharacterized protein n=1 Tax=Podoviridae sp. ctz6O13 TaxID=2827757 RepID=A0A8S5TKA0_9CAUD|nr:MAG TPA: hypothetical protein [Podoviridae sp. ctz6O13]